ncbi:alpha/beta hydrolase [Anaplasma bovis]|uniref:alpha/beta hydrolase n=1 Tax=Anaplasma bovis TaxID=186733 RepID=UPI002FF0ACAA
MYSVRHLELEQGLRIAYKQTEFKSSISVVYFGGFASSMQGTKATALFDYCVSKHISCTIFDYLGHGVSDKEFTECTLSDWLLSSRKIMESVLPSGPVVIVGSSMGGWLMLLVAMLYPDRVKGVLGIAPAPDFTERLAADERASALKNGKVEHTVEGCSYTITGDLIRDAQNHLLLQMEHIPVTCPVRILHGMNDTVVDYTISLQVANKLQSDDVVVHLIKSGGHRNDDSAALDAIFFYLREIMHKVCA